MTANYDGVYLASSSRERRTGDVTFSSYRRTDLHTVIIIAFRDGRCAMLTSTGRVLT